MPMLWGSEARLWWYSGANACCVLRQHRRIASGRHGLSVVHRSVTDEPVSQSVSQSCCNTGGASQHHRHRPVRGDVVHRIHQKG
jgi:hypothetical protein